MWIRSIQVELNEMGAVTKALPHLARPCDRVAKEVLAFVSIMLFNANEPVQVKIKVVTNTLMTQPAQEYTVYQ